MMDDIAGTVASRLLLHHARGGSQQLCATCCWLVASSCVCATARLQSDSTCARLQHMCGRQASLCAVCIDVTDAMRELRIATQPDGRAARCR
jgi:hypothetical protein